MKSIQTLLKIKFYIILFVLRLSGRCVFYTHFISSERTTFQVLNSHTWLDVIHHPLHAVQAREWWIVKNLA